jgi:hypothetical protein
MRGLFPEGIRSNAGCSVLVPELLFVSTLHASSSTHMMLCEPSVKVLMASLFGDSATYLSVTSGCPSLIIICTTISDLNTIVHVESRSRSCNVRKTSATPDSPPFVADKMGSMYFDFGAAN